MQHVGGHGQFPVSRFRDGLGTEGFIFLPIVEIAYQIQLRSVGCPLAEHPSVSSPVQAVVVVSAGEIRQAHFAVTGQLVQFPRSVLMPSDDSLLEWFQPCVVLHESDMFLCLFFHDAYTFTLKTAFFSFAAGVMRGACASCGKNTTNMSGVHVT